MLSTLKFYVVTSIIFICSSIYAQAEKHDVNVDINVKDGPAWYANWWVWVIGAVVLVLLIAAIVGGRSGGGTTVIKEERSA